MPHPKPDSWWHKPQHHWQTSPHREPWDLLWAVNTPIIPPALTSPQPPKTNTPKCSIQHASGRLQAEISLSGCVCPWQCELLAPAGLCPPGMVSPWAVTMHPQVCAVFGGQRTPKTNREHWKNNCFLNSLLNSVFSTEWVWKAACFTWIKQLLTRSQKRAFGLCLLQEQ